MDNNTIINEDERQIMKFYDEDGNIVEFEGVAKIYLKDIEYLLLAPLDEESEDIFVFRVDIIDDKEEYNFVEDDKILTEINKEYKKLLY